MKPSISVFALAMALPLPILAQTHETHATTSEQVKTQFLLEQLVNEQGIQNKNVIMEIVTFPPLNVGSPHRHPCPLFAYVLEGELESTFEGKVYHYKQGDVFYEQKNGLHQGTRNLHSSNPAKLLVFYISEKGATTYVPEVK